MRVSFVLLAGLLVLCVGCRMDTAVQAKEVIDPLSAFADEIPPEIQQATTYDQLEPFLDDENQVVRMAAVRRLGEIGTAETISVLMDRFWEEPRGLGMAWQRVKVEIIDALYKIGGEEAMAALLDILGRYTDIGPRDTTYIWRDGDYAGVVSTAISHLVRWHSDDDVYQVLRDIALNDEQEQTFSWTMREKAYEGYLLGKMSRDGVTGVEACVNYLLPMLTGTGMRDWIQGKTGVKPQAALRNMAIVSLLIDYGAAAKPHVQRELEGLAPDEQERREALQLILDS